MALFSRAQSFEFPANNDRVAIVGSTGQGKSTFALWLIAESADYDRKPWVIVDYKGETIVNEMIRRKLATIIPIDKPVPKEAGIYVLQPSPHEADEMAAWLWEVWRRGKIGLVFDELYMVPEFKGKAGTGGPLKSILTQGRSKEIPVYGLSQRPVDVNVHVFSEAQFIVEFYLKRKEDIIRVRSYVPEDDKVFYSKKTLPRHWCKFWDDKRQVALLVKPCPNAEIILDIFEVRLENARVERRY
jgi:DNA helicase HerA-like ATPase